MTSKIMSAKIMFRVHKLISISLRYYPEFIYIMKESTVIIIFILTSEVGFWGSRGEFPPTGFPRAPQKLLMCIIYLKKILFIQ